MRDQMGLPRRTEETPEVSAVRQERKDDQALEQGEQSIQQGAQNMDLQRQISNAPGAARREGGEVARSPNSAANRPVDTRSRVGSRTVKEEPSRRVQRFVDDVESGEYSSEDWPSWVFQAVAELAKDKDDEQKEE
jgi:Na+-transporting NADH:ubiquinone oxidoreductase subunit NqrC